MELISPVFENNGKIPTVYTCEGKGISPPLLIKDVPTEAVSLVLIMDDPDVPSWVRKDQMFDHWVVYNISPHVKKIEENNEPDGILGKNSTGKLGYFGPCPPDREHRYFFKLYALSIFLPLDTGATKKEVEKEMNGYILAKCELIGKYEKDKK